jgi:hypothetical protein
MAQKAGTLSREAEIEEVVRRTNLPYPEAAALVALRHGEDVSDIVGRNGPLTDEQRRRLGLGRSLADYSEPESKGEAGSRRATAG